MEAAEAQKQSAGFKLNGDPGRFLQFANYLDPKDPIDELVIGYKEELDKEGFGEHNLPTAAQQRQMVAGVKDNDFQSTADLAYGHMGLIAAIAYPFKNCGVDSAELLQEGRNALIRAAKTYDEEEQPDFNNHAVSAIHDTFSSILPDFAGDSFAELDREHPILGVYKFLETVKVANGPVAIAKMEEQAEQRKSRALTPEEIKILPLLMLSGPDISLASGLKIHKIEKLRASLKQKFGNPKTSEELALVVQQRGMEFDIREIDSIDDFTVTERRVAMRLGKSNADIGKDLNLSKGQVEKAIASLNKKTDARSRAELLLIAHNNSFEPTEEELNPPPDPMEGFSIRQRKIIPFIASFSNREISSRLKNATPHSVNLSVNRIQKKVGASNRVGTVLELHRRGVVEFAMAEPDEPLSDILSPDEIEIAKLLHLPSHEKIAKHVGKTKMQVRHFVRNAKNKTGVDTTEELALMVEMFYDEPEDAGEELDVYEWKLARRLGSQAIRGCDIRDLLDGATERQRKVISAYYLTGERTTWKEVSKKFGMEGLGAMDVATAGIRKIRQARELDNAHG